MRSNIFYILLALLLIVALFLLTGAAGAQGTATQQRETLIEYAINERPLLAELLTTSGLAPTLSGSTSYTLLIPSEAGLQALRDQPAEKVRSVLAMHIIKGSYKSTDFKEGASVETYGGEKLSICRKRGTTLLNGVSLRATDLEVRNGVVQELEGLLQP